MTPPEELEWQTRQDRIDKKLKELPQAWRIIRFKEGLQTANLDGVAVAEFPTQTGPADYALFVQGKLLGVIEAKRVGTAAESALGEAKRYSKSAINTIGQWGEYRVPFLYSSNGERVFHLDARNEKNITREISNFHTPDALLEFFEGDSSQAACLTVDPARQFPKIRPYQKEAVLAVEAAIQKGQRQMLVAMATGTGKTYLTVAQIYRLLESKRFRRVLFLVDRRALAAQAVREFASFATPSGRKFDQDYQVFSQRFHKGDFGDDEPFDPKVLPNEYLANPSLSHTFVYVSTIQRMTVNLLGWQEAFSQVEGDPDLEEDTSRLEIPNHAFDLVIADECHRGYTARDENTWRAVLNYFDAVKIGLTATPAAHSLTLFREVVYRYTTEDAILDGYLVDYEAVKIRSNVLLNGAFLREGEHVGLVDTHTGKEVYDRLEDEREFSADEVEYKITAPETNRKIIKEIALHAGAHEKETGRFPKVLIFAANDLQHTSHADQLVRICREEFGQGDDFVQKITGNPNVDRPLQKIREFRNRPNPKVVVTVDMLSTGVDIPSLEFIVFLRPVRSRILWVQMLGRGTRKCDDIGKEKFVVFDCFDGTLIQYFRNTTDFAIELPQKEPVPLAQVIENIYQNVDREYNVKVLIKRLRRIEKNMSGEAREMFAAFIPDGDVGRFAGNLRTLLANDFTGTMKVLRDKKFQDLFQSYPRAQRSFMVGYEIQDNVTSEFLVGGQRAEDYIVLFERFVRENPGHIEAIEILLKRPKQWRTAALNELKEKLARNNFPEKELQHAHRLVYKKSLADIVSMVKHAAKREEPVLTAEERVQKAMVKITKGKVFTPEQQQWLICIRQHLVANLTLDLDDFDLSPVLERHGGKRKAEQIFAGQLVALIEEINYAIAA